MRVLERQVLEREGVWRETGFLKKRGAVRQPHGSESMQWLFFHRETKLLPVEIMKARRIPNDTDGHCWKGV